MAFSVTLDPYALIHTTARSGGRIGGRRKCPFDRFGGPHQRHRFGFTGPEIFPIDNQISQLHVADLDGDGLNDIIVVNNARSKINLLYNQTGKTNAVRQSQGGRDATSTSCRPTPASASNPSPPRSASPRWWWPI